MKRHAAKKEQKTLESSGKVCTNKICKCKLMLGTHLLTKLGGSSLPKNKSGLMTITSKCC